MPNHDEEEQDIKFGWAEAFAAALSGLTGGDFAGQLSERIEDQKRRKERKAERDEDTDRYERNEARTVSRDLADIMESLGLDELERKRISESIPMGNEPSVTMTGIPEVDALLSTLSPKYQGEAAVGARGRAMGSLRREESDYNRDLSRRVGEIPLVAEATTDAAIANDPRAFEAEAGQRQTLYDEQFTNAERIAEMQRKVNPPQGPAGPSIFDINRFGVGQLEGVAYDFALQLKKDPRMTLENANELTKAEIRDIARRSGWQVTEADISAAASKAASTHFRKGTQGFDLTSD